MKFNLKTIGGKNGFNVWLEKHFPAVFVAQLSTALEHLIQGLK